MKQFGFRLNKEEFVDAITLRYDLKMSEVSKSRACGKPYSISHCLTCKKGGFINIRHNAVRDTTHKLLTEICKDVRSEPALQSATGEDLPAGSNRSDGARADVSALGLWAPLTREFLRSAPHVSEEAQHLYYARMYMRVWKMKWSTH